MAGFLLPRRLAALAAVAVCLCAAGRAGALVQHVDETPPDKPHEAVVGRWRTDASAVAIGPNHIITTRHQYGFIGDPVWFDGVEYVIGTQRLPTSDGLENADIRVVRIWATDGKPANLQHFVGLYESSDEVNQEIILGGFGKSRGTELKTSSGVTYGYTWAGSNNLTQRWGANEVLSAQNNLVASPFVSDVIRLDFDDMNTPTWTPYEAAGAQYDSGGGWFIYDEISEEWKVAALTAYAEHATLRQTWFRHNKTGQLDPDWNAGIRVSGYATWIKDHSATYEVPPGDATLDGQVNVGDLGVLAAKYGTPTGMIWTDGDFTCDGAINVGDLGVLAANYEAGGGGGAIPEPATAILLATAAACFVFRRRGRKPS